MFKQIERRTLVRGAIAAVFTIVVLTASVLIAMAQGTPAIGGATGAQADMTAPTRRAFIETARDTSPAGEGLPLPQVELSDAFELLYQNAHMAFYYREDRNVFAIRDMRNNYIWKSGLDAPFFAEVDDFVRGLTREQIAELDHEVYRYVRMGAPFIAMANSVLTVEFFNEADAIMTISSGSASGVTTTLAPTAEANRFIMTSVFHDIDLTVRVHITFDGTRIIYDIPNDDITGAGRGVLAAIHLVPFKGAAGGVIERLNPETGSFERENIPMIPGYIFVPDGSGALIRFNYNYIDFTEYRGHVFGRDYGLGHTFQMWSGVHVPLQNPAMPVFGINHWNGQAGFVAYATTGAEYMEIVAMPHQHTTYFNFAYPRFVFNRRFLQVYNMQGGGFLTRRDTASDIDITMVYEFLAAVDGQLACHVGMAQAYRAHLIETGQLVAGTTNAPGVRVDFFMSDISPNIVSHTQVALTTADDVRDILTELDALGVQNITTNLFGWQAGGVTGGHPGNVSFRNSVGSRRDFIALAGFARDHGIRLSFAQDYFTINSVQMMNLGNAARHYNGQFMTMNISAIVPPSAPVTEISFARPVRSAQWLSDTLSSLDFMDYHSIFGISSRLISDHTGQGMLVQETRAYLEEAFENASRSHGLFLHRANQYLFRFAAAYLDIPVFTSQHLIQTDTVPFLQMVLHGTMDLFAPYSNFSFYTERDVLRMIDYNIFPSFIVTQNPSHLLQHTNSAHLYSTEYGRYRDMIVDVSNTVYQALSQVAGYEWINRQVVKSGVVVNTYQNSAGGRRQIIINYTDYPVTINDIRVGAVSAQVVVI